MNLNGSRRSLKESRAISKKTYTNFCPQTGSCTGLNRFSEIPNPKHMGCSERYGKPMKLSEWKFFKVVMRMSQKIRKLYFMAIIWKPGWKAYSQQLGKGVKLNSKKAKITRKKS